MAIISITDTDQRLARIPKGTPSLRLSFDDVFEESLKMPVGCFPDMFNAPLAVMHGHNTLPDGYHAENIVRFIRHKAASPEMFDVIVHCETGISRSAAVAQFIADQYQAPINQCNSDTSKANLRLLRLLNKAINDEPFTMVASITGFSQPLAQTPMGMF